MARTTPAQKPRGWARITFISFIHQPAAGPRLLWTAYNGESPSRRSLADQLDAIAPRIPAKRLEHLGDDSFGVEARLRVHRGRRILIDEQIRQDHATDFQSVFQSAVFRKGLQDEGAEAADRALFDRDQHLVLARQPADEIDVEGLGKG